MQYDQISEAVLSALLALTDQGTFGETESEIKYVMERLSLSESIGDEGTFLNGCFKK